MADVERPFDPDYFTGHPVVNSLFNPDSMETFKSSPEHKARLSKSTLASKLDKEARRQKKDNERARLHQEVKDRLYEELREHESIQSQLHGARDSIERKRAYADKAEKEVRELDLLLSAGSLKEDQLAIELAKLQVELSAYQSKLEGAKQELQSAQDLTEELTADRNKAKDEAVELREKRRKATEQRRLDAARREGMMQGKLEGMYTGWEDGKIMGYREGRKNGALVQHDEMVKKDWKLLQRELPEYDGFEERIPSPVSTFTGDVPEPLRELPAPIILPPAPKKPRRPAPPPETVYHNEDEVYFPQPVHSPETTQRDLAPISQPTTRGRSQRPTNAPTSARSEQEPRARSRPRTNMPPPRPVFELAEHTWEPPPSRPEVLQRSATQRAIGAIGDRVKRKREDIVPAPENMDFAPFAAQLPYPTVATPLPQSRTMMPGRAVPTPAPSIYGRDSEEEFDRDMERRRAQQQEGDRTQNKPSILSRLNTAFRGGPSQPAIDPSSHPLAYQSAQSTPHLLRLDTSMSLSSPSSPLPSPSRRSAHISAPVLPPAPVWPPPPSPRHPRPAFQDVFVPSVDAQGKFTLPPPHEMEGSAMESAINLTQSQNPSRNPSPTPSNRSHQRPRSRPRSMDRSRDPSPSGRLSHLGGSIRKAASGVIHAVPSRGRIREEFRGHSRSGSRSPDPHPIRMARERSRERERSRSPIRPRSGIGMPNTLVGAPEDGLLRPEHIHVLGGASGTTVSEMDNASGRHKGTAMSQVSGRSSPGGMSIESNGALGLSRGGDGRDAAYVTYPVATLSTANLSRIEEERNRLSGYNRSPSSNFRQPTQHSIEASDFFPPQPPGPQRQYTDNSIREYNDGREPWDPSSRFPPPAPSIRSQASSYAPPPPVKSPRAGPYPWSTRPVPAKITMPALLSAQSPTPSSRGGIAGIGAGGGFHKLAMSATALSPGGPPHHNFASPIPPASARLSTAGSFAGSDGGRPPIAPKPQPPSRRNPIILDDPLPEGTPHQNLGHAVSRSWSGEKQQISRTIPSRSRRNSAAVRGPDFTGGQTLVTVKEHRSPYMQGPEEGRRSTGSLISVHSNRLQYDPAYAIQSDLTAALENGVGQPRLSSDEGPPKVARPSVGKRVSKVLKFSGKKGK